MEFKKITISLPKSMYDEGNNLINQGFFSNFSDLVRSGIRLEFKELQPVIHDKDERLYTDKKLLAGIAKSEKSYKEGKYTTLKNDKEIDKFFEEL